VKEDEDRTEDVDQRLKDDCEDHGQVCEAVAFGVEVVFCGNNRWSGGDGSQGLAGRQAL
jgi:hypothetical protein